MNKRIAGIVTLMAALAFANYEKAKNSTEHTVHNKKIFMDFVEKKSKE